MIFVINVTTSEDLIWSFFWHRTYATQTFCALENQYQRLHPAVYHCMQICVSLVWIYLSISYLGGSIHSALLGDQYVTCQFGHITQEHVCIRAQTQYLCVKVEHVNASVACSWLAQQHSDGVPIVQATNVIRDTSIATNSMLFVIQYVADMQMDLLSAGHVWIQGKNSITIPVSGAAE